MKPMNKAYLEQRRREQEQRQLICTNCGGTGQVGPGLCDVCEGRGKLTPIEKATAQENGDIPD